MQINGVVVFPAPCAMLNNHSRSRKARGFPVCDAGMYGNWNTVKELSSWDDGNPADRLQCLRKNAKERTVQNEKIEGMIFEFLV